MLIFLLATTNQVPVLVLLLGPVNPRKGEGFMRSTLSQESGKGLTEGSVSFLLHVRSLRSGGSGSRYLAAQEASSRQGHCLAALCDLLQHLCYTPQHRQQQFVGGFFFFLRSIVEISFALTLTKGVYSGQNNGRL